jgi:hypothetical protein
MEFLFRPVIECTIIDRAPNLSGRSESHRDQRILLTFVHPVIHQEIRRSFGDRGSNTQARVVVFGVIHQPGALAGQIIIQIPQCGSKPS